MNMAAGPNAQKKPKMVVAENALKTVIQRDWLRALALTMNSRERGGEKVISNLISESLQLV